MPYSNHSFCWNGIVSANPDQTLAFFPEVLGWSTQTVDMGGDPVTMLANGDKPLAHVRGPQMEGEPTWWNAYFRVEDVDAALATAVQKGAEVLVPATDIAPGRFATVKSPSGAAFSLFREAGDGEDLPVGRGFVHWMELHSQDLSADLAFLEALGVEIGQMEMPNGPYHLLNPEKATRGGAVQAQQPGAPSHWLAWIEVDSVDDTLARVGRHGGTTLAEPFEVEGVGRLAIASDPTGVTFGVITPPAT